MKEQSNEQIVSEKQIKRLYRFYLYGRWLVVLICWLLIMPWAIWQFKETISLCQEQCTWAAIRIGMEFNLLAAVGISFCLGLITSVLVWQSTVILRGRLSDKQHYYLSQQVQKISSQGKKHWLYRWIYPVNYN